jgi:outer membrane protein, multidrug efflux system
MGRSHLEELLLQGKAPDAINPGTQDRHRLFRRTDKAPGPAGVLDTRGRFPAGRMRSMNLSVRFSNPKHAKHVIARAIAGSMLLLVLPSCGIPNLRQALPGPALPANYPAGYNGAASSENSSQVPIEEFFNDPKLTSLICQALAGNQELRILYEDVQIARNEVLGRSGAYLPAVGLGFDAGMEKFSRFTPLGAAEDQLEYLPGKHFPGLPGNFLVAANISWQVDIWRELRNARDAAVLRFLATGEGRNYAVTRLVAEIAGSYYELMSLDKRLENLDNIIALQEQTLKIAQARMAAGRGTELPVQRFRAEVQKNQSQRLIALQDIVVVENRINFLVGRYPQPVERNTGEFIDLNLHTLSVGVPAQLLQNRPDVRRAERELAAAGLDVKVARARFFPRLDLTGPTGPTGPYSPVGFQAFNPKYLFWTPASLLVNVAGDLTVPLINKRAIKADYLTANARQLQSVYNYQRVLLTAFTEVVTRLSKVQNYSRSIELRKQQVASLMASVDAATKLFLAARVEYIDVLFAQRAIWDARFELIETKLQQLTAIVNVYQALGGGLLGCGHADPRHLHPGPILDPSQPGGSDPSGTEQLPPPRKQPEQLPAPGKQPEQFSGPNPAQPGRLPEPGKLPTYLPPPGATLE